MGLWVIEKPKSGPVVGRVDHVERRKQSAVARALVRHIGERDYALKRKQEREAREAAIRVAEQKRVAEIIRQKERDEGEQARSAYIALNKKRKKKGITKQEKIRLANLGFAIDKGEKAALVQFLETHGKQPKPIQPAIAPSRSASANSMDADEYARSIAAMMEKQKNEMVMRWW
jgi:hypothetical protein